jgi:hypothetical protein
MFVLSGSWVGGRVRSRRPDRLFLPGFEGILFKDFPDGPVDRRLGLVDGLVRILTAPTATPSRTICERAASTRSKLTRPRM